MVEGLGLGGRRVWRPTSMMVVNAGSLVLSEIATLVMHEARALAAPHGQWYVCTSKRRPLYTPLTSEEQPTPWQE